MGCHLSYGIGQCYLPPYTSKHTPPAHLNLRQTGRCLIYLPPRDGRLSDLPPLKVGAFHQYGIIVFMYYTSFLLLVYTQNPLHQFPRSKSVTRWRLLHNKSVTTPQHKRQVRNKSVYEVGSFPVYREVTGKRV